MDIPPSVSQDTSCELKVHIRHLRRKKAAMCKLLKSDPQIVSEDKETGKLKDGILENMEEDFEPKIENYDKGKRGSAEPEISEAKKERDFLWELQ